MPFFHIVFQEEQKDSGLRRVPVFLVKLGVVRYRFWHLFCCLGQASLELFKNYIAVPFWILQAAYADFHSCPKSITDIGYFPETVWSLIWTSIFFAASCNFVLPLRHISAVVLVVLCSSQTVADGWNYFWSWERPVLCPCEAFFPDLLSTVVPSFHCDISVVHSSDVSK